MGKSLVIVESPAKAKTIGKFLGKNYVVKASMGHVRDLPKSQFGIDIENGFQPKYITIRGKGKILQELREAVKKTDRVYLATDPDREGEAISWHLSQALDLNSNSWRVEFHEITKAAVKRGIQSPRKIDLNLVNAQQARRVLDRLVGYELSPLLWAKVKPGLSAGRVQSVAVRLICDREEEILTFVREEYWTIAVLLSVDGSEDPSATFKAKLAKVGGKKPKISSSQEAEEIVAEARKAQFVVSAVQRKERRRYPAPPFTTSSLQQEASRKLGFTARKTMMIAQQLYEGLDMGDLGTVGLITYIRTDATRVAAEAVNEARRYVHDEFGPEYVPETPPHYKSRAGAQAAHEAIRPTHVGMTPEEARKHLKRDQYRLYKLIWERFIASQMSPAVYDTVSIDVTAGKYLFRASGSTLRFPGFISVYVEKTEDDSEEDEEASLPEVSEGQTVSCKRFEPEQHFTQPPPRYTEAMLVKTLEELGIGRPSTYAPTIDTIQKRGYVVIKDKRFEPTELGKIVVGLLKEHFPDIISVEFTANLEDQLDRIEEGQQDWVQVVNDFYTPFSDEVEKAKSTIKQVEIPDEETDEICEKCGRRMVIKYGRYGKFLACPGFPECRNTKPILEETGVDCPKCGDGRIVVRRTKRGRVFYGCTNYPECDFTTWYEPTKEKCPKCGSILVKKNGRKKTKTLTCINESCGYERTGGED